MSYKSWGIILQSNNLSQEYNLQSNQLSQEYNLQSNKLSQEYNLQSNQLSQEYNLQSNQLSQEYNLQSNKLPRGYTVYQFDFNSKLGQFGLYGFHLIVLGINASIPGTPARKVIRNLNLDMVNFLNTNPIKSIHDSFQSIIDKYWAE